MSEFIDDLEPTLTISAAGAMEASPVVPLPEPPEPTAPEAPDPLTPWDHELRAEALTGPFHVWLGQVVDVHYDAADGLLGYVQAVEVVRAGQHWTTNNEPAAYEIPQVWSNPETARIVALPWPPRHDQEKYHVSTGDIVSVISGPDGRHYFFSDDLPFPAVVMQKLNVIATQGTPPSSPQTGDAYLVRNGTGDWSGHDGKIATWDGTAWTFSDPDDNKEKVVGGAYMKALRVRRQSMSGDPAAGPANLAEVLTAAGATVEYHDVLVIAPDAVHHGYRVGDTCWVRRRGSYYFVLPAREQFPAYLVNEGPDGEADFADHHYWVREYDGTISYTDNTWTRTDADRDQTDPTGGGGRKARWVKAVNLAEQLSQTHHLKVVAPGNPTTGLKVTVSMFQDPETDDTPSGGVWYEFCLPPEYKGDGTWIGDENGGKTADFTASNGYRIVKHLDWDSANLTTVGPWHGLANAQGAVEISSSQGTNSVEITPFWDDYDPKKHSRVRSGTAQYLNFNFITASEDVRIGEVTDGSTSVSPCDKITFTGNSGIEVTVTDDGNEDATVTISSASGSPGAIYTLCEDIWVRITDPGSVPYTKTISTQDYRGRMVLFLVNCHYGTVSDANDNRWSGIGASTGQGVAKSFTAGKTWYSAGADADMEIVSHGAAPNTVWTLYMEEDTGNLYIEVSNYNSEVQVRVVTLATDQKDAADVTIP